MSTRIKLNVTGNQLVQRNKEEQLANRNSQLEKEIDAKFAEEVKAIETEAIRQVPPLGAVPEYRVIEETSAQRGGDFPLGWVYESYEDIIEQEYVAENIVEGEVKNKYRVAVGSGNGKFWEYAEAEVAVPLNARDGVLATATGPIYTANTTLEIALPPVFGGNLYQECEGVFPTLEVTRTYASSDSYKPDQPMVGSFILPLNTNQSVLVGSIVVRWRVVRQYTGGTTALVLPSGWISDTSVLYGPAGTKTYLDAQGVPITIEDTARCAWERPTNFTGLFPPGPTNYVVTSDAERMDFAFLVSGNRVTRLKVKPELKELLESIFPTPEISGAEWSPNFWPDTSYAALGVSFNVENVWGLTLAGAPSIFDILDNNNNFDLFKNTSAENPGQSNYAQNVPRYSPDAILDPADSLDKEIPNIYSAFYFGRKLSNQLQFGGEPLPVVPPPPPSISGTVARLNEYIYLTAEDREESDYYAYSSEFVKDILDEKLIANPGLAFMEIKNPDGGVYQDPEFSGLQWKPTTGFSRNRAGFKLSGARVLPPALFSTDLTPHPLIKKQRTFYAFLAEPYTYPAYSRFELKTLFWTAWGRNWRGKLSALGISFAPYTEET